MSISNGQLVILTKQAAAAHALDPALVCAIVEQESAWNPWAARYEPAFYQRYIAPLAAHLTPTEAYGRAWSFGLMQIMGEVAREKGYTGDLTALCDPATGLEWGCVHFADRLKAAGGDVARALQLWNGGGNAAYSAQVLARVGKYRLP
jgi:soluble lytic murein transglycosylase-like protein